jgi:hypothetical protein
LASRKKISSTGFLKSWSSEYGEFEGLASWRDDDSIDTDSDLDTNQLVYLKWRHNPDYRYRTFEDQANAKGFIGDGILPVNLLKKLYFKRKPSFDSGRTTVNLKVDNTREGNLGAEYDISWLEKAPLIIKANPNTSNTDESDSGGAISASLGQVITKDFENDTSKYIEITPKLVANKTYKAGDIFEFEVLLTAGTSEIPSLLLYLDFDENILSWNGVYANSIQGISLAPGIRFNSEEQLLREDTWQEKYCRT